MRAPKKRCRGFVSCGILYRAKGGSAGMNDCGADDSRSAVSLLHAEPPFLVVLTAVQRICVFKYHILPESFKILYQSNCPIKYLHAKLSTCQHKNLKVFCMALHHRQMPADALSCGLSLFYFRRYLLMMAVYVETVPTHIPDKGYGSSLTYLHSLIRR